MYGCLFNIAIKIAIFTAGQNKIASRFPQTRRKQHIVMFNLRIKFNLINKITKSLYLPFSLQHGIIRELKYKLFYKYFRCWSFLFCCGIHSQTRHRLAASCGFYWPARSCQQVAAGLLTSSTCSLLKSDLLQVDICRLVASWWNNLRQIRRCQFAASLIEQLAASLMNASMLIQVEKIRLAASCYPQACCKLFHQLASSLWITSLIKQLAASLLKSGLLQLGICRLVASW